jgi:hypothetical protein
MTFGARGTWVECSDRFDEGARIVGAATVGFGVRVTSCRPPQPPVRESSVNRLVTPTARRRRWLVR